MAAYTFPAPARLALQNLLGVEINATTEGAENTIVAGVENKKIIVLSYVVTSSKEGVAAFKDGTNTWRLDTAANGGASYPGGAYAPAFVCAEGAALKLETVASGKAHGHITYCLV